MSAEVIHASASSIERFQVVPHLAPSLQRAERRPNLRVISSHTEYPRHARLEVVPRTNFKPDVPPQLFDLVQEVPSSFALKVDPNRGNQVAFAGKIELGHGKANSVYEDSSGIAARGFIEKDGELRVVVDQYFARHPGDPLDFVEGTDTVGLTGMNERVVRWEMSLKKAQETIFTHSDISASVGLLLPGEVQKVPVKIKVPLRAA